jgi:hypothetical protein
MAAHFVKAKKSRLAAAFWYYYALLGAVYADDVFRNKAFPDSSFRFHNGDCGLVFGYSVVWQKPADRADLSVLFGKGYGMLTRFQKVDQVLLVHGSFLTC